MKNKISKIFIFCLAILAFSCGNKFKIEELILLDKKVSNLPSLYQFTTDQVSKSQINNQNVCFPQKSSCSEKDVIYSSILKEILIDIIEFNQILDEMNELELVSFTKYNQYSLWSRGGAFGHIEGYLIDNSLVRPDTILPFTINNKYFIVAGKELYANVYYFSGN
ncbi:MAG TPA: hypothetical protein PLY70_12695 [Saprospiraceae bacterium]|nr:hypothetical protein [Saprospiraceae bacterium]HPN69479.1 hypothetical protein [Saprospiraceae bacterium]